MKSTGDVMGHPLWMLPVMILGMLAMIEGIHTTAHLHMQIDADAYCRNNAEWVDSKTKNEY